MEVRYRITDVVRQIENATGSKGQLEDKLGIEYTFGHITEKQLLEDLGFTYEGKSSYMVCPTYRKGNIFGFFNEGILHITEFDR